MTLWERWATYEGFSQKEKHVALQHLGRWSVFLTITELFMRNMIPFLLARQTKKSQNWKRYFVDKAMEELTYSCILVGKQKKV